MATREHSARTLKEWARLIQDHQNLGDMLSAKKSGYRVLPADLAAEIDAWYEERDRLFAGENEAA